MTDLPLLCGVAGVGHLGQHHARLYREVPGAKLAGVYDVNTARAAEIEPDHAPLTAEFLL